MKRFFVCLGCMITPGAALATTPYEKSAQAIEAIVKNPEIKKQLESQNSPIKSVRLNAKNYTVFFDGIGFPNPMNCWLDVKVETNDDAEPVLEVGKASCEK